MSKNKNYNVSIGLVVPIAASSKAEALELALTLVNPNPSILKDESFTVNVKKISSKDKYIKELWDELQSVGKELIEYKKKDINTSIGLKQSIKESLNASIQSDVNFNLAESLGYITPLEVAEVTINNPPSLLKDKVLDFANCKCEHCKTSAN